MVTMDEDVQNNKVEGDAYPERGPPADQGLDRSLLISPRRSKPDAPIPPVTSAYSGGRGRAESGRAAHARAEASFCRGPCSLGILSESAMSIMPSIEAILVDAGKLLLYYETVDGGLQPGFSKPG